MKEVKIANSEKLRRVLGDIKEVQSKVMPAKILGDKDKVQKLQQQLDELIERRNELTKLINNEDDGSRTI